MQTSEPRRHALTRPTGSRKAFRRIAISVLAAVIAVLWSSASPAAAQDDGDWTQRGDDIGAGQSYRAGIDLSDDGNTLVIAPRYGRPTDSQRAAILDWDSSTSEWVQRGAPLVARVQGVAISGDGSTIAVASIPDPAVRERLISLYEVDAAGTWQQQGQDFVAGDQDAIFRSSILEMSTDGDSAVWLDYDGPDSRVVVVDWDAGSSAWVERSAVASQPAVTSLSLSGDGDSIAVSYTASLNYRGSVQTFTWDHFTATWFQRGNVISAEALAENGSVALTPDGNTLVIGSGENDGVGASSGHIRIFDLDPALSVWVQRGPDIDGRQRGTFLGSEVAVSADGNTVVSGASFNSGAALRAGRVKVFSWDSTTARWLALGNQIDGEAPYDYAGTDIRLSADGRTVAILSLDARQNSGAEVEVFDFDIDSAPGNPGNPPGDVGSVACSADRGVVTWSDRVMTKYWVYRSVDFGANYTWLGRTDGATTFTDPSPAIGAQYLVHYPDYARVECSTVAEPRVVGSTLFCNVDEGVITWNERAQTRYWVYKSTDDGASYQWLGRTLGDTTFTDPSPAFGTRYQVHHPGIARVDCAITAEPAASDASLACDANAGVITWNDLGASKYWIYKSTDGGSTYQWLGRTTGATTFTDTDPSAGTKYQVHYAGIARVDCTITA